MHKMLRPMTTRKNTIRKGAKMIGYAYEYQFNSSDVIGGTIWAYDEKDARKYLGCIPNNLLKNIEKKSETFIDNNLKLIPISELFEMLDTTHPTKGSKVTTDGK